MKVSLRSVGLVATVLGALLLVGTSAEADPLKCQRTISKESAKLAQAKMKALGKCEEAVLKGKIAGPCPDVDSGAKITKAEDKMKAKVEKACGGADKTCATTGDNDPLASIGWDVGSCPGLLGLGCNDPIVHCGDIGTCLVCIIDAAVDQAIDLYYGDLSPSQPGSDLNKCQIAVGKETGKFFKAKSKVLQKCEDSLLKGKAGFDPGMPCPSADLSGKSEAKLAKAQAKMEQGVCKKCGGPDKLCDNVDDLTPAEIGFSASCPAVEVPGGDHCSLSIGTVNTLAKLVACAGCVTEFDADCMDALGAPTIKAYPDECSGSCTPPVGPCPTSIRYDAVGDAVDLDPGWTGMAHDADIPFMTRLSFDVSACAGTDHPTCGQCTLSGPIRNVGGKKYNNQRCRGNTGIECTSNADCPSGPPDTGPCSFFLGPPLPLSVGGISVCITNEITEPISGTIDVEGNTSDALVRMTARAYTGPEQDKPCPNCIAGFCHRGQNDGAPCTINGMSPLFGEVSFDCAPDPGASVGNLKVLLNLGTGGQTWSLSAASPNCRSAPGYSNGKCFCDTCATNEAEPCASNADCPGGAVCGGRRCQGGSNAGAACVLNSECPGGACGVPGLATAWNQCDDTVCVPNTPPDDDSTNEGVCAGGPFELYCAIETFRGCTSDAECPKPGDSCTFGKFRECFTDNGVVGTHCFGGANGLHCQGGGNANEPCTAIGECPDQGAGTSCARVACATVGDCPDTGAGAFCGGGSVSVSGAAGTSCGLRSDPVVASLFCVAPTASSSVNNPGGLPGPGRVTIPTMARFDQ